MSSRGHRVFEKITHAIHPAALGHVSQKFELVVRRKLHPAGENERELRGVGVGHVDVAAGELAEPIEEP